MTDSQATFWRLIATAPTDGTTVLLTWDSGQLKETVIKGYYDGEWKNMAGGSLDKYGRGLGLGGPTHWFPLLHLPHAGSRH